MPRRATIHTTLKSSHGIIQGYNANAMVDAEHQVIVHALASMLD